METVNNASIAKRLAKQVWGDVSSQKKIMPGAWYFSCASHGGYIVDLNLFPQFEDYRCVPLYRNEWVRTSENHFAILEEDCNFALFEYSYRYHKKFKREDFKKYEENLVELLKEWNSEWYSKYNYYQEVLDQAFVKLVDNLKGREYEDVRATALGLRTLYDLHLNQKIEDMKPSLRMCLRDAGFIFYDKGYLPKVPQIGQE